MEKPAVVDFDTFALNEKKKAEAKYTYACAMMDFDFPDLKEFHKAIDKEDIFEGEPEEKGKYGLEKDSHVTLLYGLHDEEVKPEEVKDICTSFEYEPLTLTNLSIFDNPKYDVLKFDVKGKLLYDCNKKLVKLPHTTDYPDYHPHATVAYLKPGKGKKYVKEFKDKEYEVVPSGIVYSRSEGKKLHWKIDLAKKEEK
jgi:2'-5' RNA ligase